MGGGCAVLTLPGGPAVPLEPFRSPLEHLVEHVPVDVLRAHASRFGGHPARIAPRLTGRVDIPATVVSDDATERHLLFEAVGDVFRRLAEISPVVTISNGLSRLRCIRFAISAARSMHRCCGSSPPATRTNAGRSC